MGRSLVVAVLLGLAGSPAAARDLLPLKPGVYVDTLRACRGASNADTASYWGSDNGINVAQLTCKITRMKRSGAAVVLDRTCRPVGGGGTFDDRMKIRLLSRTTFTMAGRVDGSSSERTYRYCGSKLVF